MFNLDEEKLEFTLGNRAWILWHGKETENVVHFISDVEIWGIYLSLILDSSEIKQLD